MEKSILLAVALMLLAACAPNADLSRCVPATDAEISTISAGLVKVADGPMWLGEGWAVKSKDYKNVWMVAAYIYGNGEEMEKGVGPGVWAHGGEQDDPRMILSAEAFARNFSTWERGDTTDAEISILSDGVKEAIQCAEANHK